MEEEVLYQIVSISISVLSIIGSFTIIRQYFFAQVNVAQKLILYLSMGDIMFVISNLIYIMPGTISNEYYFKKGNNPNNTLCSVQAALKQASCQSTFFSSFFISFCIYNSVIRNQQITKNYFHLFRFFCLLFPVICAVIPIFTKSYGSALYTCVFASQKQRAALLESLFFFYIPLWMATTLNLSLGLRVFVFLRMISTQKSNLLNKDSQQEKSQLILSEKIILIVLLYPLILSLCWAPYTVYKVLQFFEWEIKWLNAWRFVFPCGQGFLNSLVNLWGQQIGKQRQVQDQQLSSEESSSQYSLEEALGTPNYKKSRHSMDQIFNMNQSN